jgi:hypothetical protein
MFQMSYQPPAYDSAITTIWDLAQFNVSLIGGIVQSGMMVFNCYSSSANVGNNTKILSQKSYTLTAAEVSAFQAANNIAPGQVAALAYGLAKAIQDCAAAGVNTPPPQGQAGVSFFVGATTV